MVKATDTLVIEVDDDHNRDLFFPPVQARVRGSFDAHRAVRHSEDAGPLLRQWPLPIPGQRIQLDPESATGEIVEPLHSAEHKPIREKLKERGLRLAPERQRFENVHVPSWLHYMKRACDAGHGRLVEGRWPDKIGAPKRSFIVSEAVDSQESTIQRLVAVLYAQLTPEQQKAAAAMIGE